MPRTSAEKTAYCSSSPGQVVAVHVEKLRTDEAEPHRAVGQRLLQLDRQFEIAFEGDLDPVAGDRGKPAQARETAPFARHRVAPGLVFADRLVGRVDDNAAVDAVDHRGDTRPSPIEQTGYRENRRQAERSRNDRGVALGAAGGRRKAGHALRVDQRGIGRGQLFGENDGAVRHGGIGDVGLLDQIADQPRADDPDVLDPRRQVGIAHRREALGDFVDLDLHRALGVDPGAGNALVDAADEARVRQHGKVGIEKVAHFLGGGAGQPRGFRLHLLKLFQRVRHGLGEAVSLGFDFALRDVVLSYRKIAALDDMSRADGNSGGNGEARQSLFGAAALRRRAGDLLNPHQICIRRAWRAPPPPPRRRDRWRRAG